MQPTSTAIQPEARNRPSGFRPEPRPSTGRPGHSQSQPTRSEPPPVRAGMTMVVVTLEVQLAREVAYRVIFMDSGVVLEAC